MNYKVLNIVKDEMVMEVFINPKKEISLSINEDDVERPIIFVLNKDDAIALRDELSELINEL